LRYFLRSCNRPLIELKIIKNSGKIIRRYHDLKDQYFIREPHSDPSIHIARDEPQVITQLCRDLSKKKSDLIPAQLVSEYQKIESRYFTMEQWIQNPLCRNPNTGIEHELTPQIQLPSTISVAKKSKGKKAQSKDKTQQATKIASSSPMPKKNEKDKDEELAKPYWSPHGYKHVSPKNSTWEEVVKNTKKGPAKYCHGIEIEKLEREVWKHGTKVTNGKPWKVIKLDKVIGAKNGIETSCMRVEMTANTIHGHPITLSEYLKLLR